jgi:hypothetical protein
MTERSRDDRSHELDGGDSVVQQPHLGGGGVAGLDPHRQPLGPPPLRSRAAPLPQEMSDLSVSGSSNYHDGSNLAILRQQAASHAPPHLVPAVDPHRPMYGGEYNGSFGSRSGGVGGGTGGFAIPPIRSVRNGRVSVLNVSNESADHVDAFPEEHNDDDMTTCNATAGWSEVDSAGGGIPPSARSLHSTALLNGVMYIFGECFR